MYSYIPKLHHAIITAVMCIVSIALCGKAKGSILSALEIGAVIFAIMTAVIMWWLALESGNHRTETITEWMNAFAKLDDEGRAAVAFTFPTIHYKMKKGEVREMFEDTNVPIDLFRRFLQTSNDRYISPKRDWQTKEMPAWVWLEIHQWLQANDYILPDSAAGSVSWLWKGGAYRHLYAYWMAGRKVENMSYAYEDQ